MNIVMAKRRILKKDISRIAGDLFSEVLVCKLYIPGVDKEKADALLPEAVGFFALMARLTLRS